ncbi:MAG: rod shape-determining protein MreC [Pseudanabaenaceae cyanobacterium]
MIAGLRRWWEKYAAQLWLVLLGLVLAVLFRFTNGTVWLEAYQWLSRPFQRSYVAQAIVESAQVQELRYRLQELEAQNQQLRQAMSLPSVLTGKPIWSQVIGRSADSWWQQVIIAKGARDGIKVGAIVTGAGGLVGRVTEVSPHSSRVLLISDPNSNVGVVVSRSRALGILRGQSQSTGIMEFLDRDPDAKVGDGIATSTFSTLYPEGIPVGRIRSLDLNHQPAPEAVIEFSAPIPLLEFVAIYAPPHA